MDAWLYRYSSSEGEGKEAVLEAQGEHTLAEALWPVRWTVSPCSGLYSCGTYVVVMLHHGTWKSTPPRVLKYLRVQDILRR